MCTGKIVETALLTRMFFLRLSLSLLQLKMKIEKERRAAAAFTIATAAIIEEKKYKQQKCKGPEEWIKKNGCSGLMKNDYTTYITSLSIFRHHK